MAIEAFSVIRAGIWATKISTHQFNYYQCSFSQHQTLNREDISNNVCRQYPALLAFKVLQSNFVPSHLSALLKFYSAFVTGLLKLTMPFSLLFQKIMVVNIVIMVGWLLAFTSKSFENNYSSACT